MDWLKTTLLGGMGVVAWLLVIEWTQFQEANEPEVIQQSSYASPSVDSPIPQALAQNEDELPVLSGQAPAAVFVELYAMMFSRWLLIPSAAILLRLTF